MLPETLPQNKEGKGDSSMVEHLPTMMCEALVQILVLQIEKEKKVFFVFVF